MEKCILPPLTRQEPSKVLYASIRVACNAPRVEFAIVPRLGLSQQFLLRQARTMWGRDHPKRACVYRVSAMAQIRLVTIAWTQSEWYGKNRWLQHEVHSLQSGLFLFSLVGSTRSAESPLSIRSPPPYVTLASHSTTQSSNDRYTGGTVRSRKSLHSMH